MTYEEAAAAFRAAATEFARADDAWSAELGAQFGRNAGDVRYTAAGHGEPGTHLRRLSGAFDKARDAFWRARDGLTAAGAKAGEDCDGDCGNTGRACPRCEPLRGGL